MGLNWPPLSSPEDLLDLTDLCLDFAPHLFIGAFSFHPGIIAEFPDDLLDLPLGLMELAFRLVRLTGFHGFSPRRRHSAARGLLASR
jgi:hypothetical protein